jgi:hypothetical protein
MFGVGVSRASVSWQVGIRVVDQELACSVVVDESLVE